MDLGIGRSREDAVQSFLLDRLRVRWWVWLWSAFWRSRQLPCSHMAEEVVGQVTVTARAAVIPEAVSRIFAAVPLNLKVGSETTNGRAAIGEDCSVSFGID